MVKKWSLPEMEKAAANRPLTVATHWPVHKMPAAKMGAIPAPNVPEPN